MTQRALGRIVSLVNKDSTEFFLIGTANSNWIEPDYHLPPPNNKSRYDDLTITLPAAQGKFIRIRRLLLQPQNITKLAANLENGDLNLDTLGLPEFSDTKVPKRPNTLVTESSECNIVPGSGPILGAFTFTKLWNIGTYRKHGPRHHREAHGKRLAERRAHTEEAFCFLKEKKGPSEAVLLALQRLCCLEQAF
jgi:hypothetical protein